MADVDEILARLDDLEATNSELRARIDTVEQENERLREQTDDLRAENNELRDRVEDLEKQLADANDHRASLARDHAMLAARVTTTEETVEAVDTVGDEETSVGALENENLTPIEQLARLPEHVAADQLDNNQHRNTYRGRSIVRDWSDYCTKTPRGELIKNRDLVRVLSAQEEGCVESKTGIRVMDRIETLSRNAWAHTTHNGEHILVLEAPDKLGSTDAAVS